MTGSTERSDPRYAGMDALHRYAHGLDGDDGAMMGSVFTEDAVIDFQPAPNRSACSSPRMRDVRPP